MLKKGTIVKTISNEYVVQNQVNQGGNGALFKVNDDSSTVYALKAIDRTKTSKEKLKRFHNEIAFCSNNHHPCIVSVLDSGTYTSDSDDLVFYIMPYYPNTLRDLINTGISGDRALVLFSEIAEGLKFAHQKGVWHRDIKPENILIDEQGHAVIADFGIAHFCEEELATFVETAKHDRLANFQYAAPEQRNRGQTVDGRADIFSLGLILNEMFTRTIISGVNYQTIANVNGKYAYLDEIVSRMICQNPQDRVFPVEKIAFEILALQKEAENAQKLRELAAEQSNIDLKSGIIEAPKIINVGYDSGRLIMHLDVFPDDPAWLDCLRFGTYMRSYIPGYDPRHLEKMGNNILAMIVRNADTNTMKQILGHVKTWLPAATTEYNKQILRRNQQEKEAEDSRIREEIKRMKKENEIREALKAFN